MHGVNLDLLRCTPYHPDGRPKDSHAHHLMALADQLHQTRLRRRRALLDRIPAMFQRRAPEPRPCLDHTP